MKMLALTVLLGSLASSEPASKEDVQELKQEVRELREILLRILEAEEARSRGLAEVLAAAKKEGLLAPRTRATESTARTTESTARTTEEPRRSDGKGEGSITGSVRVTGTNGRPAAFV